MATVKLKFPDDHNDYQVSVNLDSTTPFDLMVYAVYVLGNKPVGGSIWKMRKSTAGVGIWLSPFKVLGSENNSIDNGDTIEFS